MLFGGPETLTKAAILSRAHSGATARFAPDGYGRRQAVWFDRDQGVSYVLSGVIGMCGDSGFGGEKVSSVRLSTIPWIYKRVAVLVEALGSLLWLQ